MRDVARLLADLGHPGIAWEAFVLLACGVAAYGICWLAGRRQSADSVWFGSRLFDGVLFPILALAFTYSARVALGGLQRVPLLRLAVPVLISIMLSVISGTTLPGNRRRSSRASMSGLASTRSKSLRLTSCNSSSTPTAASTSSTRSPTRETP